MWFKLFTREGATTQLHTDIQSGSKLGQRTLVSLVDPSFKN